MRLAIVTGGSKGIGKTIVEHLVRNDYKVFFTYQKSTHLAETLARSYPNRCHGFQVDGCDRSGIASFADEVIKEDTPYVLINNAGINNDELFYNQDLEAFWETIKVNFGSTINYCKVFLEAMMEKKEGHIINISSVAANKAKVGNSAYGASKAAIERFSKSLALEVARFNIHVNCISPAYVKTNLFMRFLNSQNKKQFYSQIPMRKVLTTDEISRTVLALCDGTIETTGSIFQLGNGENIC